MTRRRRKRKRQKRKRRAFVKRLQDTGKNPAEHLHYYENIEGGHGGAADAKQQAFMTALYLEFLKGTIGSPWFHNPKIGRLEVLFSISPGACYLRLAFPLRASLTWVTWVLGDLCFWGSAVIHIRHYACAVFDFR